VNTTCTQRYGRSNVRSRVDTSLGQRSSPVPSPRSHAVHSLATLFRSQLSDSSSLSPHTPCDTLPLGSGDIWDDMDYGEQCVDYFCFGPRENRGRFRPWKKKSRAVIEADSEERAKKGEEDEKNPETSEKY
jgi:hypothetical protein